ncbi:hypothetical protein L2E82_29639 [Cichorium intybus]|uniref:Uncharacterized protein n=1 Tax=Cichorium intybus TaxID=13427 RepID=A0ACB9CYB1_CICIN|nr:hypothetical protein L2E82_29639 [Cichorium intybus]
MTNTRKGFLFYFVLFFKILNLIQHYAMLLVENGVLIDALFDTDDGSFDSRSFFRELQLSSSSLMPREEAFSSLCPLTRRSLTLLSPLMPQRSSAVSCSHRPSSGKTLSPFLTKWENLVLGASFEIGFEPKLMNPLYSISS